MNDDIYNIFTQNMKNIIQLERAVKEFRCQNYYNAILIFHKIIIKFNDTVELIFKYQDYINQEYVIIDQQMVMQTLEDIVTAQENEDYVLLADLLELRLVPFLINIQSVIQKSMEKNINPIFEEENFLILREDNPSLYRLLKDIEVPDFLIYKIENTAIGLCTLKITDTQNFYMHSNGNPYKEADFFADEYYDSNIHQYIVFGLGLGYHIDTLLARSPINTIEVYEADINVIKLALGYSDMADLLSSKRVTIIYDPEFKQLAERLKKDMSDVIFILHQPSIRKIRKKEIRHSLEEYFMHYSSLKNQGEILHTNFKENVKLQDLSVDVVQEKLEGKKLIILAGGPSLDKNIDVLREYYFNKIINAKSCGYIIMVVGTVLKKVLDLGIIPDYVIISDAQPYIKKQIENVDTSLVSLIYLSTVSYEVPKNYTANRYIVFQEGLYEAEEYSKKKGATLFKTGGSVVTTALDLGLRMKCSSVIFLGLDLAYTNLQTHAQDTQNKRKVDKDNLREVLSVNGDIIYTTKNLDSYRKWIERRIADENQIQIIDATEGGALIKGMEIKKLSEVLI